MRLDFVRPQGQEGLIHATRPTRLAKMLLFRYNIVYVFSTLK